MYKYTYGHNTVTRLCTVSRVVACSGLCSHINSYAFNGRILYLPDTGRKDTAEFFQVGDVEQGNFLINKLVEVRLEGVIWSR